MLCLDLNSLSVLTDALPCPREGIRHGTFILFKKKNLVYYSRNHCHLLPPLYLSLVLFISTEFSDENSLFRILKDKNRLFIYNYKHPLIHFLYILCGFVLSFYF